MLEAYTLGFDSSIATSFNIFPQLGLSIYENVKKGQVEQVRSVQEKLTEAVAAITKHGKWSCLFKIVL